MKTFEQKRGELRTVKEKMLKEFEEQLKVVDADIELLNRAELLLSDKDERESSHSSDKDEREFSTPANSNQSSESNVNLFKPKGEMTVRNAVIEVLKRTNHPLHIRELMPAVKELGILSDRKTVRARVAKMVGKDVERVAEATYEIKN